MLSHKSVPYVFGGTSASHFIEEKMKSNSPAAVAGDLGGCQLSMVTTVMMGLVLRFSGW